MNSSATFTIVSAGTRALAVAGSALITLALFAGVLTIADSHEAVLDVAAAVAAVSPLSAS
ncbi:MAG: hypothetical protein RL375_2901 [Pseudomonadota bacterium]|jgi:hypothetical protein